MIFSRGAGERRAAEPRSDPLYVTGSRRPPPAPTEIEEEPRRRRLPASELPVICIIVDDFGPAWDKDLIAGFLNLSIEITVSVIPGYPTSTQVARRAAESGREVFVHLPMEPEESVALKERDMIHIRDDAAGIRRTLDRALTDIPMAVGINNHMGSKATSNRPLMDRLAAEVRRRGLCFVDSRTIHRSTALRAMLTAGVPAIGRDLFLDVKPDSASVVEQLYALASIARRRGWAVGIGHVKWNTLAAIQTVFPQLETENYRFVSAGRLINEIVGEVEPETALSSEP